MFKVDDYKIVVMDSSGNVDKFNAEVNGWLKQGYELYGGNASSLDTTQVLVLTDYSGVTTGLTIISMCVLVTIVGVLFWQRRK